ncbi:vWA domain-containing protein [Lacinutrix mariniflava]|uniref:vWA domain-containing protein n=1 Tax=Lacinutrix mariniflava TaxID=342955 RepID=UPI0006E4175A|nr:vWA domain-containing protein [Lacinutrix mariniflava]
MSKELQNTDNAKKGKLDLLNINTSALTASLGGLVIPRLFYQLVVFVLDGSGSMSYPGLSGESKGKEVENAVKQVFERLLNSKNKNSFDINIWAYANESVKISSTVSIDSFDLNQNVNPCDYIDRYDATNLISTLEAVKVESKDYITLHKNKNAQVLVVILSDGALDEYEQSSKLCDSIKELENVTVSSIFYESKTWQENYNVHDIETLQKDMESLASDKSLFTSTLDPEEIRKHMIKSISTVSKID